MGIQEKTMTKRNSYIAAAVLAVTGALGMAGWVALEADEAAPAAVQTTAAQAGVSETEASLPPAPVPPVEAPADEVAFQPATIGGRVPAVRTERTPVQPVARAANRTPPERVEPVERERAPEPAEPRTEPLEPAERVERVEPLVLRVPANAVIGVRLSTSLSSDTAEIEDRVEATVTRDVIADGHVAIPAGTKVLGSVNAVTRGGKFKERARLSVRFHTLVLADGTRESVKVDSIVREGESPVRETAAKIGGGAAGGAIVGGIMGGRKGAILGGIAGAGAGTAATAVGDRSVATLAAGSPLSVRLDAPVTITREQ
jgi:type IV secretory pathway VirB10-like protein